MPTQLQSRGKLSIATLSLAALFHSQSVLALGLCLPSSNCVPVPAGGDFCYSAPACGSTPPGAIPPCPPTSLLPAGNEGFASWEAAKAYGLSTMHLCGRPAPTVIVDVNLIGPYVDNMATGLPNQFQGAPAMNTLANGTSEGPVTVGRRRIRQCPPGWSYNPTEKLCTRGAIPLSCDAGPPRPQPQPGNPTGVYYGDKLETAIDFSEGRHLKFTRRYHSRAAELPDSAISKRWRHNFELSLGILPTQITLHRSSGESTQFVQSGGAWVRIRNDSSLELTATTNGWMVKAPADSSEEYYDSNGRLTRIVYLDGDELLVQRDPANRISSITDSAQRSIQFAYMDATDPLLASVTAPSGLMVTYQYTTAVGVAPRYLSSVSFHVPGQPTQTREYLHEASVLLDGALTGIIDETGQRFSTYAYDTTGRVTSSTHHASPTLQAYTHTFSYPGAGYRTTVVDPIGTSRTYDFQQIANVASLTSVSLPCPSCGDGTVKSYLYDSAGNPRMLTDFRGNKVSKTYESVRNLEIVRIEGLNSNNTGNDTQPARPRTDERKTETSWHAQWRQPVERKVYFCSAPNTTAQPCTTASNSRWTLEHRQTWTYNSRGQVLTRSTHDGGSARTMTQTWCESTDADFGSETCPLVGKLKTVDGPRTDVTDVSTYRYYDAHHSACASDPVNCAWRKGDLKSVTNALGQVESITRYDNAGRKLRSVDANGVITDTTWHARGWLASRTVRAHADGTPDAALDATTTLSYEPYGEVRRITQPDGSYIEFERDQAHRITALKDNLDNRIEYTLDGAGNRTAEQTKDPSGTLKRNVKRQFDALSRLSKLYNANETHFVELKYDANGNTIESIDQLGNITGQSYDPLNRLIETLQDKPAASTPDPVDPGTTNASTKFEYDSQDRTLFVTDPNKLVTGYTYDALGQLDVLHSPDTGVTQFGQDGAGNRTSQTDARGVTTSYTYDALNRLVNVAYTAPTGITDPGDTTYQFDQADSVTGCAGSFPQGRLTRRIDPSGTTAYCYDHRGNLTRQTWVDAENRSHVTGYAWTLANHLAALTYPSGAVVQYTRDAIGRITGISRTASGSTTILVSSASYLPFGPLTGLDFGHGESLTKSYDQDYRIVGVSGADLGLDYLTDASGDIIRIDQTTDGRTQEQLYDYDDLHRLIAVRALDQSPIDRYTYDKTGNRLSHQPGSGSAVSYNYTNAPSAPVYPGAMNYGSYSHRLLGVGSTARSYDAVGNTLTGVNTTVELDFDASNRMDAAVDTAVSGSARDYQYNGGGERVRKTDAGGGTHGLTHYDLSGQVLEQSTWTSVATPVLIERTEVIWLDRTPVALVRSNVSGGTNIVRTAFLSTDQLSSPRLARESGTGTVWRWDLVMGSTASGGANAFGDQVAIGVGGSPLSIDLRFPGQFIDAESGLHQNYFRDYEARSGRYVESDPIGLAGGLTSYSYAGSDGLNFTDPYGLQLGPVPRPALSGRCWDGSIYAFGYRSCPKPPAGSALFGSVGAEETLFAGFVGFSMGGGYEVDNCGRRCYVRVHCLIFGLGAYMGVHWGNEYGISDGCAGSGESQDDGLVGGFGNYGGSLGRNKGKIKGGIGYGIFAGYQHCWEERNCGRL